MKADRGNRERGTGESSVAIIGLGLIGGSIARRLSDEGWRVGWIDPAVDGEAVRSVAPDLQKIDSGHPVGYSIVVLATPTGTAIDLASRLDLGDAVVTSVCSVMAPLVEVCARRSVRFVAGHPMAGREVRGWSNSVPSLFDGQPWFRSEVDPTRAESMRVVDEMITACGASVVPIDPLAHDRYAALASHLPQLLSSALAALVEQSEVPEPFRGPGLRTFLRLAGSSWSMWEPVFEHNAEAVAEARRLLDEVLERVERGEGRAVFERAKETYRKMQR